MIDFRALRDRLSKNEDADQTTPANDESDPREAPLPFAGYDGLSQSEVINGLSDHSQIELKAAEAYERSHDNRAAVLDKLRYMRGREPLPSYDALEVEEIVAALGGADWTTIKKVRAYERKFAKRRRVLDEVTRAHRADNPAGRGGAGP